MNIDPYLLFKGECAEAFRFYEKTLGGKIVFMQTHGESPMKDKVPAGWQDKVIHVALQVGDRTIMDSDAPPEHYAVPQGFSVSISVESVPEAERIFNELAQGGKTTMPFQKTFWSPGFGMATDRFGTPWMVNANAST